VLQSMRAKRTTFFLTSPPNYMSTYEGVARLFKSSIPATNLVAFVGVYEPPREVYALLHEKAICAILGTMGNLDSKARRNGIQMYIELLRNGADILATDEVELASEAITRYLQNRAESR